jgi:hypothetical protein
MPPGMRKSLMDNESKYKETIRNNTREENKEENNLSKASKKTPDKV